jgi:hypothetical protein
MLSGYGRFPDTENRWNFSDAPDAPGFSRVQKVPLLFVMRRWNFSDAPDAPGFPGVRIDINDFNHLE